MAICGITSLSDGSSLSRTSINRARTLFALVDDARLPHRAAPLRELNGTARGGTKPTAAGTARTLPRRVQTDERGHQHVLGALRHAVRDLARS